MKKALVSLLICLFVLPAYLTAQPGLQTSKPNPQQKEKANENTPRKNHPTKTFMPNKNYKRIAHTGEELPSSRRYVVTSPATGNQTPSSSDARLTPVAPKHKENTQGLIISIEDKLQYIKSLEDTPQNRLQIAQLEQQLVTAYQQLSFEKECNSQH